MPFNTLSVGAACAPSVVETYFSHYFNRAPLREKPTAHISYHEGLKLIRHFLEFSSKHTVEDLQAFTAQFVPSPYWVLRADAEIVPSFLERAALVLQRQLGYQGLTRIGGKTWWQWRRPDIPLRSEWIEMRKDYQHRKRTGDKCERCILYVHGGAYYFGSVDEHRYQIQRHARKIKARVLAPRYRLAPQFPFPCGLHDCLGTYFYLLEHFKPNQILFAGDSAGGGMLLSMLVTLRDQGQPLPAGTILLSPWVDLTHSFPSVTGDDGGDYIPSHGFIHKPSMAWPPAPSEAMYVSLPPDKDVEDPVELAVSVGPDAWRTDTQSFTGQGDRGRANPAAEPPTALPTTLGHNTFIQIDGEVVEMKEQVQMYTTNALLAHPLVSPVNQPSLGGLPPMLIQVGGSELLRDEQIYIAHKAANPGAYLPSEKILNAHDPSRQAVKRYPPTDVQLQVWDDLCHVPHTLSFTRPAKYMYRSVAQFGDWALSCTPHVPHGDDDALSVISSDDHADKGELSGPGKAMTSIWKKKAKPNAVSRGVVGRAGEALPPFKDHMIRQRVTRHGLVYDMPPSSAIPSLAMDPEAIGIMKPEPVKRWLAARAASDARFTNEIKRITKARAYEEAEGYDRIPGEQPPPTALAGRRKRDMTPEQRPKGKSWGLAIWSGWGSSHDEQTLRREEESEKTMAAIDASSRSRSKVSLAETDNASTLHTSGQAGSTVSGTRKFKLARSRSGGMGRLSVVSLMADPTPNAEQPDEYPAVHTNEMNPSPLSAAGDGFGSPVGVPSLGGRHSSVSMRVSSIAELPTTSQNRGTPFSGVPQQPHQHRASENPGAASDDTPSQAAGEGDISRSTSSESRPTSMANDDIHASDNPRLSTGGLELCVDHCANPLGSLDGGTKSSPDPPPLEMRDWQGLPSELSSGAPMAFELCGTSTGAPAELRVNETEDDDEIAQQHGQQYPRSPGLIVTRNLGANTSPLVSPIESGDQNHIFPREALSENIPISPFWGVADDAPAREPWLSTQPAEPMAADSIFGRRTSLLGTIGADGMPNFHHEFPATHPAGSAAPTQEPYRHNSKSSSLYSLAAKEDSGCNVELDEDIAASRRAARLAHDHLSAAGTCDPSATPSTTGASGAVPSPQNVEPAVAQHLHVLVLELEGTVPNGGALPVPEIRQSTTEGTTKRVTSGSSLKAPSPTSSSSPDGESPVSLAGSQVSNATTPDALFARALVSGANA